MRTAHAVVVMLLSITVILSVLPVLPVKGANAYPVASFTYTPAFPQPYEQITFNASSSYDPDGYIVSYKWNFGDGFNATVTTPVVSHMYYNDGTYQVTLLVTDNKRANSLTAKNIIVNSHAWFRLVDSSGNPISNVTVTVYYSDSASSPNWYVAPAGPDGMEIQYDLITQPNLSNSGNKYRNPGYTASILHDTSNIGFEIHPSDWYIFFKFQWGSNVLYWPNETNRVFSYDYGTIETHYYKTSHQATWNSYAGTYVIKSSYIESDGVNPKSYYPIFIGYETVPAMTVSISPSSATLDVGQSQTFTSTVLGGTTPYSYQWYLNGAAVSGATSPTWTFTPSSAGSYTVYLNVTDNTSTRVKSNVAAVTVNAGLSVSISPGSATLDVGQSQLFTSSVSGGTSPLSYQWYLNGAAVSGATSTSWTFTPSSAGSYSVYLNVTDNVGVRKKSNTATVTVNGALSANISPGSVTLDVGQSQLFTSSVSGGTSPYTYQWYLNGSPVSGATSNTWTFTPSSSGSYTVYLRVTDAVSVTATSNTAQITVNGPISVGISPTSVTRDVGQSQVFTSSVSGGTSPYAYQWYLNGSPVSGAISSTWTFTTSSAGAYTIYVRVTDNLEVSANSNPASVTVNAQLQVTILPTTATIYLGQSQACTSSVSGGTSPFSYQWYLNGSPVPGATSSSWTFVPGSIGTFQIYVKVTDNVAVIAQSSIAQVTVNTPPSVTVSISPSSAVIDIGQSVAFTSSISGGTSPFSYQWYLNSVPVTFATSASWTFTPSSTGTYQVCLKVTDSLSEQATSPTSPVTVNALPSITISPSSATVDVGQSKTFISSPSGGTSPYSYQWYLNAAAVVGATSASWTFTPSSAGNYQVYVRIIDNVAQTVSSNTANIIANPALAVSVTPVSVIMDVGQSTPFTASVSGGTSPFSYQWYLNSAPVSGATSSTWTFTPTSAGSYSIYVIVTDSADVDPIAESSPITATVNPDPAVTVSPSSAVMDTTQSQLFTSSVSGGTSPYTYQWYLDGALVPGATSSSWVFTPSAAGSYTVYLVITDNVAMSATSNTAHVTANGVPTISITPASSTIHVGDTVAFASASSGGTTPYTYQWYLNGAVVPGATSSSWTCSEPAGSYMVFLNITDSMGMKAKSNAATVTVLVGLSVSISPPGASFDLGDSVSFTSTVNGGVTPYYYQWYLNGAPVPGATLSSWTFTPSSTGSYNVYLNVTDSMDIKAKSNVAGVTVVAGPVGGFSTAISASPMLASWLGVVSLLAAAVFVKGIIVKKKRN